MPEFHAEPYIYLAGLSHKSALIAWGAFYFRARSRGGMKIVDDHDLQWIHPPRCDSIGCRSKPFGPAVVEVRDEAGTIVATALTNDTNHVAISGLEPNTRYSYTVHVKHEIWASGARWDWDPAAQALEQRGGLYRNESRTLPDPTKPLDGPFTCAVIGDFGTGLFYRFRVASDIEFVCLDTSRSISSAAAGCSSTPSTRNGCATRSRRRLWAGSDGGFPSATIRRFVRVPRTAIPTAWKR